MLMYVDPDEKSKGEIFKHTIEGFEKDLDFSKFQILVILNLNATWKPNAIIESLLKDKVKDYPKRVFITDKESVLVKKWGLKDDEYNMLVISKDSKLLHLHSGKWTQPEIQKVNKLIRNNVK